MGWGDMNILPFPEHGLIGREQLINIIHHMGRKHLFNSFDNDAFLSKEV